MTRRSIALLAGTAFLSGLAVLLWWSTQAPTPESGGGAVALVRDTRPARLHATVDSTERQSAARHPRATNEPAVVAPAWPESLAGTTPDGGLGVDAAGRLVVAPEVRIFFDYFLAAMGELPAPELRALIVAEIEARLPATAATEAVALLDRYLEYRRQARATAERGEIPIELRERFTRLRELRRAVLGDAVAEAFFGGEEAVLAVDLERREILRDATLPERERERRLWEIEQRLPEHVREARAAAFRPAQLQQDEQQLRAAGGSEDEIRALRLETVGEAATERLEQLDREELEWQNRLDAYRTERARIAGAPGLSEAERAARIADLRGARFSATELLRVDAIERRSD